MKLATFSTFSESRAEEGALSQGSSTAPAFEKEGPQPSSLRFSLFSNSFVNSSSSAQRASSQPPSRSEESNWGMFRKPKTNKNSIIENIIKTEQPALENATPPLLHRSLGDSALLAVYRRGTPRPAGPDRRPCRRRAKATSRRVRATCTRSWTRTRRRRQRLRRCWPLARCPLRGHLLWERAGWGMGW